VERLCLLRKIGGLRGGIDDVAGAAGHPPGRAQLRTI
jgi:hypothetical protein